MASSNDVQVKKNLQVLTDTAKSTRLLLRNFTTALSVPTSTSKTSQPANSQILDPLALIHDAAKLLKAHTTKLSLLAINQPFTPSAISHVIKELSSTCLPALMSALELCVPSRYGRLLYEEAKSRVRRAMRELDSLIAEILLRADSDSLASPKGRPKGSGSTRDILPSTGVLWAACDSIIGLKTDGIVGIVVKKAQQYHDLIKDALQELKEWSEVDADEVEDEEDPEFSDDESANDVARMLEGASKLPKDNHELRKALSQTLRKLRLVNSLYQAVIKRRLKTIPVERLKPTNATLNGETGAAGDGAGESGSESSTSGRVDEIIERLRDIPDSVDELASAFYGLDEEEVRYSLEHVLDQSKALIKASSLSWEGIIDEYSRWTDEWLRLIDQP